jgi:SAM-dependent methyltransferase
MAVNLDFQNCLLCGTPDVTDVGAADSLTGVTSDSKPHPWMGQLRVCRACGHVQKRMDPAWRSATDAIYADYNIYQISSGAEVLVFAGAGPQPRSVNLVRRLLDDVGLPPRGKLLDVGCGKGAFLAACSSLLPQWQLAGSELDDRCRDSVLAIPGVRCFHSGPLGTLPGGYDVISLMHVLEHIPRPVEFLEQLSGKLVPGGLLFAQVPFFADNAFDLLVTDHCSHFAPPTMARAGELAGFGVHRVATDWVVKEISLVLHKSNEQAPTTPYAQAAPSSADDAIDHLQASLSWLREVQCDVEARARHDRLYLFGTSTAGSWLRGAIRAPLKGYVDEDPLRWGKQHLGLPVSGPGDVPSGSVVYVALPQPMAGRIGRRLQEAHPQVRFVGPPEAQPRRHTQAA